MLFASPPALALRHAGGRLAREVEVRPGAHRDPRRREPGHVHRLQPAGYKLFIWTLSAVLMRLAGRSTCPRWASSTRPRCRRQLPIEIAICGGVGGRGTLIGLIIGAFIVNGAKSWFYRQLPEYWLFFLGLLFIVVTLFRRGRSACRRNARQQGRAAARTPNNAAPHFPKADARAASRRRADAAWDARPSPAGPTRPVARRDPLPRRHHRQLRRLPGAEQARLTIDAGELRCIIGPNGAGKTTMMDVITGKTRPDAGKAFFARPST